MTIKKTLTILLLCTLLIFPSTNVHGETNQSLPENTAISTWLWNTQQIVDNSDNVIKFLSDNKVNTVYLQIDYNLRSDYYKDFISKASSNNISVHALDGSPEWVSEEGTVLFQKFFRWLTNYQANASETQKFSGVHLDVEPYENSQYNQNTNQILENYQQYINKAVNKCKTMNLPFAIDIPFWFHGVQYNNKFGKGYLAQWIFKRVENVTIMAYRDTAEGDNGVIAIAKAQMNLCSKYNVKATIAVETGKLPETEFVTFYEEGLLYMYDQLNVVHQYYKSNTAFNGFAIHYLENWMAMSQ